MSISVTDFLTAALSEIRVVRGGDVVDPDTMALALTLFNEYLDALNAEGRALYSTTLSSQTITPSLQPHTMGVAANAPTWNVSTSRPARILSADLYVSSTIRMPIMIRDEAWWMNVRAPLVTSALPTDLYYSADYPNGNVYFWPVPSSAKTVLLLIETLLAQVALTDTFDLPVGYQQALRLSCAELFAPHFGQTVAPSTAALARDARARVWGNNDDIPNAKTRDAGMPGARRGGFDYRTGFSR